MGACVTFMSTLFTYIYISWTNEKYSFHFLVNRQTNKSERKKFTGNKHWFVVNHANISFEITCLRLSSLQSEDFVLTTEGPAFTLDEKSHGYQILHTEMNSRGHFSSEKSPHITKYTGASASVFVMQVISTFSCKFILCFYIFFWIRIWVFYKTLH